jgi:hypothetical protein
MGRATALYAPVTAVDSPGSLVVRRLLESQQTIKGNRGGGSYKGLSLLKGSSNRGRTYGSEAIVLPSKYHRDSLERKFQSPLHDPRRNGTDSSDLPEV